MTIFFTMSTILRGHAIVAQSGGPTTVINSSACGVIEESLRHRNVITGLVGANNGILGIVQEDLFDLSAESPQTIADLRCTPASAIGSCRYKLGDLDKDRGKYRRLLEVFRAHNIRYFFYIGGNDSMDTADKVDRLARQEGYDLRVLGVPKTIDNDLVGTDHCPGYGSVAKFLATCVMEAGRDTEAMYTVDPVTVMEAMGRNTGWIAAATGLASRHPDEAPHLIYVPEIPFSEERFLEEVREVHRRLNRVFVVVSEGIKNEKGQYVAAQAEIDAFGHRQLGGVADYLRQLISRETGLKARYNKLDTCQRNAMHFASLTDSNEAYACGQAVVRFALEGITGKMAALQRESEVPYRCGIKLVPLVEVANGVKPLPRDYMNVAGNHISQAMRTYAGPLILGEVPIRIGDDGLPSFARFLRRPVPRKLAPFV